MNIKQAEALSGVSRRNIRFYEQEGLITPQRNRENDYREYSDADIDTLKRIRVLRMVDMPLEQIRDVLQNREDLRSAAQKQREKLQEKARELEAAIRFCEEFESISHVEQMDPDAVLNKMQQPSAQGTLFHQWVDDYKKFYRASMRKTITFVPDDAMSDIDKLTMALFRYADENDLDIVITKEGWEPELSINGYEYRAEVFQTRVRGIPCDLVRCYALHPEEFDDEDVPENRKRIFHWIFMLLPYLLILVVTSPALDHWSGWMGLALFWCIVFLFQKMGWWPLILYKVNKKDR